MRLDFVYDEEEKAQEGFADKALVANAIREGFNLYINKDKSYGAAWKHQGWMGNLARILSKSERLKNMMWGTSPLGGSKESPEETVIDLMVLCAFFIVNRDLSNQWGDKA